MAKEKLDIKQREEIARGIVKKLEGENVSVEYSGGTFGLVNGSAYNLLWNVAEDGNIYVAGLLPKSAMSNGVDYLSKVNAYSAPSDRRAVIELSRKAIENEGVVASAVEALIEVPTLGGWYISEPNEELRKLCYYWAYNVDSIGGNDKYVNQIGGIEKLSLDILYGLYDSGDEVLYEIWDYIEVDSLGGKKYNLPIKFISYDVVDLEIDEDLFKMGVEIIKAKINERIAGIVKNGATNEDEQILLDNLPESFKEKIKKGDDEYIVLDPEFTTHFSRRNNRRQPWGKPYVYRAFSALAYKYRLRALDNATIDGLIQRIWIIKIGSNDPNSPYHVVSEERVSLAVNALKKLKTNNVMVWGGSDISTEELKTSDSSILSFTDRYKSADADIQKALGVPRFLIDGEGLSGGNSDWILLAKTISQMERYQIMLERFFNKKLRQIAIENGYKDSFPKFHWMFLKLQNQDKTKNLVTKLYELNLIGIKRSLHMLGLPADEIIDEMMQEDKEGLRDKLPLNVLPYDNRTRIRQDVGRPEGVPDGGGTDGRRNKTSDPDSGRDGK